MRKIFYILFFIAGLNLNGRAQAKTTFMANDAIKTVKFFPNPAVSSINFEFDKSYDKSYSLLIYNFIGKKVFEVKLSGQKINIPLTDFYRGVYIFQVRDKQENITETGKFQVSK